MNIQAFKLIVAFLLCSTIITYAQDSLKAEKTFTKEITKITKQKKVQSALNIIDQTDDKVIEDMIVLNEIPAPPFKETKRANKFIEMFTEVGIDSVWMDKEGNVLALRKGKKRNKTIVLDAHMDTVFPEETNVTVKRDGDTYSAPGIGDNTRGMAMLISVLNAMNKANIQTQEDVVFVGTVGEEGLGDLRGVKHLFSNTSDIKIDSWVSIDGGDPGRIINGGLGSKRHKAIFKGKGGHSWGAFGLANPHHALGEAISIFVAAATKYTNSEGLKTSFSIGRMGGGTSVNSIPFESWMEVDMRSLSPERLKEIDAIFIESMKKAEANYNASGIKDKVTLVIEPIGDRPSGKLPKTIPLTQRAIATASYLGIVPELSTSSTNSNIPIALNIPAITLGRGGVSKRAHALDESWTNIDAAKNIKMALLIILAEAKFAK